MKVFKTTVLGMGPWCVEFPDGEIVTVKTEARANAIARIGTIEQAKGPLRPHTSEAMSLVKWAAQYELDSYTKEDIEEANEIAVPVIELSALWEVVEGLRCLRMHTQADVEERERLLTQLEAYTQKEQA